MNPGGRRSDPPPYFWKVPSHAKDFSQENYRRLKLIAAEGQRKLAAQMKPPQFIPGVTKNSRYAHVQSKVTASLRAPPAERSQSDDLASRGLLNSQTFIQKGYQRAGMRPKPGSSLSSNDLRWPNKANGSYYDQDMRRGGMGAPKGKPRPVGQSSSQPTMMMYGPQSVEESMYKMRLSDGSAPFAGESGPGGDGLGLDMMNSQMDPQKYSEEQYRGMQDLPSDGLGGFEGGHGDGTTLDDYGTPEGPPPPWVTEEDTRLIGDRAQLYDELAFRLRSLNAQPELPLELPPVRNGPRTNAYKGSSNVNKPQHPFIHNRNGIREPAEPLRDFGRYGPSAAMGNRANRSSQSFDIITGNDLDTGMKRNWTGP